MDDERLCSACGAYLAGPFGPELSLSQEPLPDDEPGEDGVTVAVQAWICPACGLVTWYVDDRDLAKLPDAGAGEEPEAKPATSYERRNQMMRMLRRVKRM